MNVHEILLRLTALGVVLTAEEGRLRVKAARGMLTDELKQAIATHKAEIIRRLTLGNAEAREPVAAVPRNGWLPTSFFQERLWVLDRLEPDSTAFILSTIWHSPVPVSAQQVVEAVAAVVARREILRAVFEEHEGVPAMRLLAPDTVCIERHDLSTLSDEEQEAALEEAARASTRRRFDLAQDPPARFAVFRLGGQRVAVVVTMHHIASDAWSMSLLLQELTAACEKRLGSPPIRQYADFAAWQRQSQDEQSAARELDWWQSRLAGAPPTSVFPADRQAAAGTPATGAVHDFEWSESLSQGVRAMVRDEGCTVYMAMLAALAAVLYRQTGQDDVVLGSPMGLRERPEFEAMVGPFVNLLVLRLDLSDDPTFAELLGRARDAVLDAHEHRSVPFEKVIERLRPPRSLAHSPLFQMAVVQHNAPDTRAAPIYGGGAIHEVTWFVRDVDGRLQGSIEYRADLFSAQAVARLSEYLEAFLAAAVQDRSRRLRAMPFVSDAERHHILVRFNATAQEVEGSSVVRRFERQAASTPQAVAVRFEGQELTYRQLNDRANLLARRLRAMGVGSAEPVGVCLQRSLALPVALLGVLKAGAAYVPLDPGFPAHRLDFMLADSGACVLVCEATSAEAIAVRENLRRLDMAELDAAVDAVDESASGDSVGSGDTGDDLAPEAPAYVIYTSGSTGLPKGVSVSHAALSNFLESMRREPGLGRDDVLAAVTTISFDIAGLEMYLPLIVGARIELASRDVASDGHALASLLQRSGATVLQATPATWRMLLDSGWKGGSTFRALCGGEGLPRDLADRLLACTGELWNLYGPTETTIWSTAGKVQHGAAVTIGRPIANTHVYVLDDARAPVPIGVPGELWIGGAGVAIGYHGRPELTAERFVDDPFSARAGARMYRTGDLARWLPDGQLEHLGRLDHQVKVRGFRIELGEIESALARHVQVRQAVVTARDDGHGFKELVAYIVSRANPPAGVGQLRDFLRESLPDYMLPTRFVFLEALPMTANNKVDVKALPEPATAASPDDAAPRPAGEPQGALEVQLLALWRQSLDDDRLGVHDDFFEHGGHSLKAVQLLTRIEQVFGRKLPLATLFQAPTVARMAHLLKEANWRPSWRSLVAINPTGSKPPMFLIPGVGGNVLMFGLLSKLLGPDQPTYGLQARGLDGQEKPFTRIPDMAAHYLSELRNARPSGPYVLCGSCTGGVVAFEMAQHLVAQGRDRASGDPRDMASFVVRHRTLVVRLAVAAAVHVAKAGRDGRRASQAAAFAVGAVPAPEGARRGQLAHRRPAPGIGRHELLLRQGRAGHHARCCTLPAASLSVFAAQRRRLGSPGAGRGYPALLGDAGARCDRRRRRGRGLGTDVRLSACRAVGTDPVGLPVAWHRQRRGAGAALKCGPWTRRKHELLRAVPIHAAKLAAHGRADDRRGDPVGLVQRRRARLHQPGAQQRRDHAAVCRGRLRCAGRRKDLHEFRVADAVGALFPGHRAGAVAGAVREDPAGATARS